MKKIILRTLRSLETMGALALLLLFLQPAAAETAPFPDNTLPSAAKLADMPSAVLPSSEHDLRFAPVPNGDGTGRDNGVVGAIPVRDWLWGIVLGCLAYGLYGRKNV
jgi:hypothetical protein